MLGCSYWKNHWSVQVQNEKWKKKREANIPAKWSNGGLIERIGLNSMLIGTDSGPVDSGSHDMAVILYNRIYRFSSTRNSVTVAVSYCMIQVNCVRKDCIILKDTMWWSVVQNTAAACANLLCWWVHMLCHAMLYTQSCHAMPCHAMQRYAMPCHAGHI